ncbi:unnamed protein product [Sphagnum compactum]
MQGCCMQARCERIDYNDVQICAIVLLYVQVVCALIGSLGALYTGIVVANLMLALFALVAIESGSQSLGRAYVGLLALALVLDILWFILFTSEIRNFTKESPLGKFGTISVKLTFWMQASGSVLRFVSVLVWVKMYRLGMATDTASLYQPVDFEGRIENLGNFSPEVQSPATASSVRRSLLSNEILGGSIYDPAVYSSHLQFTDEPYFSIESPSKEVGAPETSNVGSDQQPRRFCPQLVIPSLDGHCVDV